MCLLDALEHVLAAPGQLIVGLHLQVSHAPVLLPQAAYGSSHHLFRVYGLGSRVYGLGFRV